MTLNVVGVLAVLAAIFAGAVGGVVWFGGRKDKSPYRRRFVLLALFVCLWIIGNVAYSAVEPQLRYLFALISYGLAMGLVTQLLLFCLALVSPHISRAKTVLIMLPGGVMGVLSVLPGVIAKGVDGYTIITNKIALTLYGVVLLSYIITSCIVLLIGRKNTDKRRVRRVNLILIGMVLSGVVGTYCNLILPLMGSYIFTQLGPASAALFIGVIAYSIVRHGLFNIRFAVVRTVTYFLVLGSMIGLYLGIALGLSGLLHQSFSSSVELMISAGSAIILALVFQPAKYFFDRLTNRIFYRDNYNTDDFFARINRELSTTTDLRGLLQRGAAEISQTLKSEQGFFFVSYGDHQFMMAGTPHHSRMLIADIRQLDTYIAENDHAIILTNTLPESSALYAVLTRHSIAIALPLTLGEGEMSYLFLGEQLRGSYTRRDIRLLETIADELAIAIQNALSIQDVEEINATLQQRIDEATKELRASNAQLQRLDTAKDEFVSMASHQLRTPLTSVKGYISMVLEGDAGPISDMQSKLLNEAFTSSERMVHLINDFLNVSRLQTGKFMVDRRPVDLAKLVEQEVDSLQTTAHAHDLKLRFRKPSRFPMLYLDEGKLRQVVMNFIDNAIYYSHEETTIVVELSILDGDALLQVHDTGIGVPPAEQAHLFSKFFRATNARKQRPDGTGVGLFLAKKVIVAHGGGMVFDSIEGKGSTFGFRLPVKKLSLAPAGDVNDLSDQSSNGN
jgi:signal transduction histidine kinase